MDSAQTPREIEQPRTVRRYPLNESAPASAGIANPPKTHRKTAEKMYRQEIDAMPTWNTKSEYVMTWSAAITADAGRTSRAIRTNAGASSRSIRQTPRIPLTKDVRTRPPCR